MSECAALTPESNLTLTMYLYLAMKAEHVHVFKSDSDINSVCNMLLPATFALSFKEKYTSGIIFLSLCPCKHYRYK